MYFIGHLWSDMFIICDQMLQLVHFITVIRSQFCISVLCADWD
jgi:hypothetical protein